MRHFESTSLSRTLAIALVGFLAVFLLAPVTAGAKKDMAIDTGGGEGDPLDSNDYSSGGGGSSDADIHEDYSAPADDGLVDVIRSLLVDRTGILIVPSFEGGVPVLRILRVSESALGAVPHAH